MAAEIHGDVDDGFGPVADAFEGNFAKGGELGAAVVLYYFEDRSTPEIAELLGCSTATARVHVHRGRRHLAAVLVGTEAVDHAND